MPIADIAFVGNAWAVDGAASPTGGCVAVPLVVVPVVAGAVVAAGALVPEGMQVEPNMLVMGSPAKPRREVNEDEKARFANGARQYADRAALYKNECKEVE